jgi:hypothetical protein
MGAQPVGVNLVRPFSSIDPGQLEPAVSVRCDASWESIRELTTFLAHYVNRHLTTSSAECARLVSAELLDVGLAATRAEGALHYQLLLCPGGWVAFGMSVAIDMVPARAALFRTRVERIMRLPTEEACRTILVAIASGKEDEGCLPLARIRGEGLILDCLESASHVKIVATTPH